MSFDQERPLCLCSLEDVEFVLKALFRVRLWTYDRIEHHQHALPNIGGRNETSQVTDADSELQADNAEALSEHRRTNHVDDARAIIAPLEEL